MDELLNKKNEIEQEISKIILKEVEEERITEAECLSIVDFCLPKIKTITTEEEFQPFLSEISSKWPFFSTLSIKVQERIKNEKSDEVVAHIADIAQAGNLDEAVNLAKAVTSN